MSIKSQVDVIVKRLRALPLDLTHKAIDPGIRAAAKELQQVVKSQVPVKTGRLKNAIGIQKKPKSKVWKYYGHPDLFRIYSVGLDRKYRGYISMNINSRKGKLDAWYYGYFVHYGHKTKGSGYVKENLFFDRAMRLYASRAIDTVRNKILRTLPRIEKRL